MHNSSQSTTLTLDGTVVKESDLVVLSRTFDAKMIFEKQLRWFMSCTSEIWCYYKVLASISWSIALSTISLELCPACIRVLFGSVMLSWRYTPLLDIFARSGSFFRWWVLKWNLAHRRSVAVLCMLFKIKSNQIHLLSGALPLPYMSVRVTRGFLAAHGHSFTYPGCRTTQ